MAARIYTNNKKKLHTFFAIKLH